MKDEEWLGLGLGFDSCFEERWKTDWTTFTSTITSISGFTSESGVYYFSFYCVLFNSEVESEGDSRVGRNRLEFLAWSPGFLPWTSVPRILDIFLVDMTCWVCFGISFQVSGIIFQVEEVVELVRTDYNSLCF
ncbi:hypothetical protein WN48_06120 [Eufriesea mexicana]|nr:hypothetical protein WN48_06120 [Eufriesea mexicana]